MSVPPPTRLYCLVQFGSSEPNEQGDDFIERPVAEDLVPASVDVSIHVEQVASATSTAP